MIRSWPNRWYMYLLTVYCTCREELLSTPPERDPAGTCCSIVCSIITCSVPSTELLRLRFMVSSHRVCRSAEQKKMRASGFTSRLSYSSLEAMTCKARSTNLIGMNRRLSPCMCERKQNPPLSNAALKETLQINTDCFCAYRPWHTAYVKSNLGVRCRVKDVVIVCPMRDAAPAQLQRRRFFERDILKVTLRRREFSPPLSRKPGF